MSAKPKDNRPKVISFETTLDGLNIAAIESVLWPCHAFNITIPQKKQNILNVFEETVLKITEIDGGNTDKIAEFTCLDKEMVKFIQNRLKHRNFLIDRYKLSDDGVALLNGDKNKSNENDENDENQEYTVATVFVDLLSGKLLPYVSTKQLSYKKIEKLYSKENPEKEGEYEHYVNFFIKPTDERWIPAIQIRPTKDSFWKAVPDTNDIIRAIREFKKKHKRYALLNPGVNCAPPQIPMAEAISVDSNPEIVYLHCHALIQIGNDDLLVTDGCGSGFSESFANYLTSQDLQWVTKLKQKGVIDKVGDIEDSGCQSKKSFKYSEISKRIVRSKSALKRVEKLEVNSTHYESDYKCELEDGLKNLYSALEWTLRQVIADNSVSEWELFFPSNSSFRDNEKLLTEFAKKVGFTINDKNLSLLQVKSGALKQIENGNVELKPLLALAIVGANSNANHPVHRLAKNHSGFLNHALSLKRYRDPIEHGSTEKLGINEGTLKELIGKTVPMIISLVPGVAGDVGEGDKITDTIDINQERLKANIKLEKALGSACVSNLTNDMKEQLIRSEIMLTNYTDDKAIEIIKCYASVMQHALFEVMKDCRMNDEVANTRDEAIQRITQVGFFSSVDQVPKRLSTVSLHNIKSAIQGSSTTLGAHLLAVFLLRKEKELIQLKKSDPEFVKFVDRLILLRGHGNKQQYDFSEDDMESLKNNVIKSINTIMEVF